MISHSSANQRREAGSGCRTARWRKVDSCTVVAMVTTMKERPQCRTCIDPLLGLGQCGARISWRRSDEKLERINIPMGVIVQAPDW